jgi:DNA-binding XRE family transcriptional regulator
MLKKQLFTIAKNIRKYSKKKSFFQDRLSKEAEVAYNTIVKIDVKIELGKNPNLTVGTLE